MAFSGEQFFWGSRGRRAITVAGAILIMAAMAGVVLFERDSSNWSREFVVEIVSKKFDSEVQLGDVTISLLPWPQARATDVRFFHKGRRDVPPLIQLDEVRMSTSIWSLLRSPMHIGEVQLRGLVIQVPPREKRGGEEGGPSAGGEAVRTPEPGPSSLVVDEIRADGTLLRILPREDYKTPLEFELKQLRLWSASADQPLQFETEMTNAKPPGLIRSGGSFGPWNAEEPGDTPVSGDYRFSDADLGVFKGIQGILSSTGTYRGVLSRLDVTGECDVPEFVVAASGHPVHLKTIYEAVVDGTSGDTVLEPVEASFLDTRLTARGGVVQKRGIRGKTVELDVNISEARIEDLLRLAVKTMPMPLRGDAKVITRFELPPGDAEIHRRLKLDGTFEIQAARFPDWDIQKKVEGLSNRASGQPEKNPTGDVVSDLSGKFGMADGVVSLEGLNFEVPGAKVALDGDYGVDQESLDFRGTLTMDAKISEVTTGFKSLLAKIVDPFFSKKHAGAVIPIKVSGSRADPKFGLAIGGAKRK